MIRTDGEHNLGLGPYETGHEWGRVLGLPRLQDDVTQIDFAIAECLHGDTSFLTDVLAHVMTSGGKRMRSVLTLCAAYTGASPLGPNTVRRAVTAAASIELVHAGTLCHDDVIDDADVRRGLESAKRRWTNSVAVIAGDFLLARASGLVASLGDRQAAVMANALEEICRGQMIEMSHMFDISHAEDVYFASISGKTAALLVAACSLGAIEGGLGLTSTKALEEFGYHLGVLFQITDDILDLEGSVETLGKPACNDLINGVYTLPTIQALREDSALRSMLGRPLSPDDAAEARDMVAEAGGLRYARERSEWHAVAAKRALERIRTPDTSSVQALTQLVDHVRSKMLGSSANRQPAQRNGSPSAPRRDRR